MRRVVLLLQLLTLAMPAVSAGAIFGQCATDLRPELLRYSAELKRYLEGQHSRLDSLDARCAQIAELAHRIDRLEVAVSNISNAANAGVTPSPPPTPDLDAPAAGQVSTTPFPGQPRWLALWGPTLLAAGAGAAGIGLPTWALMALRLAAASRAARRSPAPARIVVDGPATHTTETRLQMVPVEQNAYREARARAVADLSRRYPNWSAVFESEANLTDQYLSGRSS